ncbi:MAG: Ig-like domain-containing protein, partial [Bacteroidales bacterium]|nr:Ig-like domain-containing protein [Bacteroidales bacterium]
MRTHINLFSIKRLSIFSILWFGLPVLLFCQNPDSSEGIISQWIKPDWASAGQIRKEIWSTASMNGCRLLLEKSEQGLLRAVLTTPEGAIAARTDISGWKSGEWHFVSVSWKKFSTEASGCLVLWIDKVAKDGPVVPYEFTISNDIRTKTESLPRFRGGNSFLGGNAPFFTSGPFKLYGVVGQVYRDYFRTAPYEAVKIDLESTRVPSDRLAVAGFGKQLGLQAMLNNRWEPVTENVVRYSQWAYFDAKPYIKWSISDSEVALVDSTGRIKALKPGKCSVIAEFHGMTATYPLSVISPGKPDAGVICISLSPRYRSDDVKNRPAAGELVTADLRYGNFGTTDLPAGMKIRFQLLTESTGNYRPDPEDKPVKTYDFVTDKTLQPGEESSFKVQFTFPGESAWMKLELDPGNRIDEFCEANNSITELTDARPIQFGFRPKDLQSGIKEKKINHIGSLSYYDWLRAEKLRMDVMLREAVWPTTGPNGVEEAYRIDTYTKLAGGNWDQEPYQEEANWYDGGFPVNEEVNIMSIDCAIIHEFGHTILSQPDLYGYPVKASNVFVKDDDGKPVAGTSLMPVVSGKETMPASGGINVPGYVGYPSLMDGCQLWLHPSQAGHVMYYKGYRPDRFWGTQGRLIPGRANWLIIKDINDKPLRDAAVYVYSVSQAPVQDSGEKYFANRPKFTGQTDEEGRFVFPGVTDSLWDDPETDEVDGSVEVWNPFGTKVRETAFTPNVWSVEGLLLIRIVSGDRSEYHFMDLTQFNTEFLLGHTVLGAYLVQTSLHQGDQPTYIKRDVIPEPIRRINKR